MKKYKIQTKNGVYNLSTKEYIVACKFATNVKFKEFNTYLAIEQTAITFGMPQQLFYDIRFLNIFNLFQNMNAIGEMKYLEND